MESAAKAVQTPARTPEPELDNRKRLGQAETTGKIHGITVAPVPADTTETVARTQENFHRSTPNCSNQERNLELLNAQLAPSR